MFDFSWSEILLIGVVALIVIGPKDLPRVLRTVGQWTSRARAIAREFQFQLDQMVRDSELDDVRKTMNEAMATDPTTAIKNYVDPTGEIEKNLAAPELHGGTPAPSESAPATPPEDSAQLALPTIGAPSPVPPVPDTPEAELPEAKSGTHG